MSTAARRHPTKGKQKRGASSHDPVVNRPTRRAGGAAVVSRVGCLWGTQILPRATRGEQATTLPMQTFSGAHNGITGITGSLDHTGCARRGVPTPLRTSPSPHEYELSGWAWQRRPRVQTWRSLPCRDQTIRASRALLKVLGGRWCDAWCCLLKFEALPARKEKRIQNKHKKQGTH